MFLNTKNTDGTDGRDRGQSARSGRLGLLLGEEHRDLRVFSLLRTAVYRRRARAGALACRGSCITEDRKFSGGERPASDGTSACIVTRAW
jgi:hypothetical protein